jgi:hypothetical protein
MLAKHPCRLRSNLSCRLAMKIELALGRDIVAMPCTARPLVQAVAWARSILE